MLPTEQPCSFVRRGERPQCVGELSKKKYLTEPDIGMLAHRNCEHVVTYLSSQAARASAAPTATQSRRGNTNHTGRWGPVHGRAVSDP